MATPRGIRNNNPGNLRRTSDRWLGLCPEQTDPDFFQFTTPYFGVRALAVILRAYEDKHGINTVSGIINRWAPSNENDTLAYVDDVEASIAKVCSHLEAGPDEPLDLHDAETLAAFVKAIIRHEDGSDPYADSLIDQAVSSALA